MCSEINHETTHIRLIGMPQLFYCWVKGLLPLKLKKKNSSVPKSYITELGTLKLVVPKCNFRGEADCTTYKRSI